MRKALVGLMLLVFAALVMMVWCHEEQERPTGRRQVPVPPPAEQSAPVHAGLGVRTKTSHCLANQLRPDAACTPGAVMTTDTATVCTVGYTRTVRNVPIELKQEVFAEYGIPWSRHADYEVDHHVSLELGGSNDIANLWPEAYAMPGGARIKDTVENYLYRKVCKGEMPLAEAQRQIAGNWMAVHDAMLQEKRTARSH
jgi:hypothetical protein